MENRLLSTEQLEEFNEKGILVIKSFYDFKTEVEPILYEIWKIIGLVIKKYHLNIHQTSFNPHNFDEGYQDIIATNRQYGAEIYDAIKQIPSFLRLICCKKNENVIKTIRQTDTVGIGKGSYGIRIDNPNEEKFRAPWHQDYLAQFGSIDGVVFWSPLIKISQELGPVQFCVSSHKDGIVPVHTKDPKNPQKQGAYGLIIDKEEEHIKKYIHISPLTEPGDLILIDFLTLHSSGYNISSSARWSMQVRYFNFNHQSGIDLGWRAGYGSGMTLKDVLPEFILD